MKNCCLKNTGRFTAHFRSVLLTVPFMRQFGGIITSNISEMCIGVWFQLVEKKFKTTSIFWQTKACNTWWSCHERATNYGKHCDHNMILAWIIEDLAVITWSCHESWYQCQNSWHGCHTFWTRGTLATSWKSFLLDFKTFITLGALNRKKQR